MSTDLLEEMSVVKLGDVHNIMNVSQHLLLHTSKYEETEDPTTELTLFDTRGNVGKIMEHPIWSTMIPFVRYEFLHDAFSRITYLHSMFSDSGLELRSRHKAKDINRVVSKFKGTRADNSFKVLTDWIATRVPCPVNDIYPTYTRINKVVKNNGGVCHIKAHIVDDKKKMTDIVLFVYACVPKLGYVVEMQIGHPFAFVTFTLDSAKRDSPDKAACVDLWDHDFYGLMKKKLLGGEVADEEVEKTLIKVLEGKQVDNKLEAEIREAIEF